MKREVIATADGSSTVSIPDMNVTYHSRHGAVQESMHVFIEAGLRSYLRQHPEAATVRIFEMGFGTGLNALLAAREAAEKQIAIQYTSVEKFPLQSSETRDLNYASAMGCKEWWDSIQSAAWDQVVSIHPHFQLQKKQADLLQYKPPENFDIIFYDAFAPAAQPELWTEAVFKNLYDMLTAGGLLVTYCSKGEVRRSMLAAGFTVEKIPGPPFKREMLRATRA